MIGCRPTDYPPYPIGARRWERGQVIVELALVTPVVCAALLVGGEVGMIGATKLQQDAATIELARWVAFHPDDDASAAASAFGLEDCTWSSGPDAVPAIVDVEVDCPYAPKLTGGFWTGTTVSSSASVAVQPEPDPSPSPSPTASPS